MAAEPQTAEVLQIKITLLEVSPPVWRRVLVPADLTLRRLHDTIQAAMGWYDQHLHEFQIGERRYGEPDLDWAGIGPKVHKDSLVKLSTLLRQGVEQFLYTYDFGDDWRHEIVIEKAMPAEPGAEYPLFVAGERRCPPEDCGGPPGYQDFLEAIADPNHPEHEQALDWYGEVYNPDDIEREIIDIHLTRIARSRRGGMKGKGKPKPPRASSPP